MLYVRIPQPCSQRYMDMEVRPVAAWLTGTRLRLLPSPFLPCPFWRQKEVGWMVVRSKIARRRIAPSPFLLTGAAIHGHGCHLTACPASQQPYSCCCCPAEVSTSHGCGLHSSPLARGGAPEQSRALLPKACFTSWAVTCHWLHAMLILNLSGWGFGQNQLQSLHFPPSMEIITPDCEHSLPPCALLLLEASKHVWAQLFVIPSMLAEWGMRLLPMTKAFYNAADRSL